MESTIQKLRYEVPQCTIYGTIQALTHRDKDDGYPNDGDWRRCHTISQKTISNCCG